MCPILKYRNKKAFAFAVDLGIAMQLTNIARDVREDACMGRRYLPSDWVNDMSPTDILEASKKPNSKNAQLVKTAIIKLLCLADQYYRSGVKGLVFFTMEGTFSYWCCRVCLSKNRNPIDCQKS
ncbi:MAG: hypothetical protein CM15mP117_18190 [Alphaproteobacteria bacterium]|nr:MAG: hypothetical protein CM15mP117_18190 [Alphaproteobacteria bacterium]